MLGLRFATRGIGRARWGPVSGVTHREQADSEGRLDAQRFRYVSELHLPCARRGSDSTWVRGLVNAHLVGPPASSQEPSAEKARDVKQVPDEALAAVRRLPDRRPPAMSLRPSIVPWAPPLHAESESVDDALVCVPHTCG